MAKDRQRWNGTGVPTQSQPQAASLTLSVWNNNDDDDDDHGDDDDNDDDDINVFGFAS